MSVNAASSYVVRHYTGLYSHSCSSKRVLPDPQIWPQRTFAHTTRCTAVTMQTTVSHSNLGAYGQCVVSLPSAALRLCAAVAAGGPLGVASRLPGASQGPEQLPSVTETRRAYHCDWLHASHPQASGAILQDNAHPSIASAL